MRPSLLTATALAALLTPAFAQDAEPEVSCDQKSLPAELAQLCASLSNSYRDAMSRPADSTGGRPQLKSAPTTAPLSSEVTARGLAAPAKTPLTPGEDRGVGVRVKSNEAPVQIYTEMVQPGSEAETILNWELRTENAPEKSGVFYGAATGGTYNPVGTTENISGFAGLRGVMNPADNFQLGAEIAPRANVSDLSMPQGSLSVEPKISAKSDLGRLGTSDFVGSLNADAAYNVPLEGEPSAWGGFRFSVKPK